MAELNDRQLEEINGAGVDDWERLPKNPDLPNAPEAHNAGTYNTEYIIKPGPVPYL